MGRRVRVKAIPKREPDIRLYVQALIALARQLQEQEEQKNTSSSSRSPQDEGQGGGKVT